MKKINLLKLYVIIFSFISYSCVEEVEFENMDSFEDVLVIEGTITNEFKQHKIKLTRTFQFEENEPIPESNAVVRVLSSSQDIYEFQEVEPGEYLSTSEFSALPNNTYQLKIITASNQEYSSMPVSLTSTTQINSINVERQFNGNGTDGVAISVNSFDPTGNSRFYRYEYEETYQIIAPFWSRFDAVVVSENPPDTEVSLRTREERVCYNTQFSTGIIQEQTNNLTEDRVTGKVVRFIASDNFILRSRYSILIKQFVQSPEAFSFFETLNELSGSQSLLSQNQPGFINGNITSITNPNERVIGFFEASSVSEQRIFFNFIDFLDRGTDRLPSYIVPCNFTAPIEDSALISTIQRRSLVFFRENDDDQNIIPPGGPYVMVTSECGDCTLIGSNIVPDFWVD